MRIKLKILKLNQEFILEIDPANTIDDVKVFIQDKEGFPPGKQKLFYKEQILKDNRSVAEYKIQEEATLVLRPE